MKNVFNHFKLVFIYIIASLISYLIIMLSNLLNIYDLVNTNAEFRYIIIQQKNIKLRIKKNGTFKVYTY